MNFRSTKKCFSIFSLLLSITIYTNGQTLKTTTLVEQRNYYLNSGGRAYLGGKSRVAIKIDLPKNTRRWFYSFSTSPGSDGTKLLNLGLQVGAALTTGGLGATVVSSIKVPEGSHSSDVLIIPVEYSDAFLNKEDSKWKYYRDISLENTKQGKQSIENIYGNSFYIGLRNPSALDGINIIIEVVAVVEEVSTGDDKATVYGNLGWKAYENGEYDKSLELSKKAVELNPNLGWVHNNVGLVLIIKNEYISAIDSYSTAISLFKKSNNPKYNFEQAIKDLNNLIAKHGQLEGANDILQMLKSELSKY